MVNSLNDVSMIDKILELKNKESKDWWNEISDRTIEKVIRCQFWKERRKNMKSGFRKRL